MSLSSTFGLVSIYIIYCFYWCQSISSMFWGGVSLYHLCLDLCQFISSTLGLVCLYHLRLNWCQFISSTFELVSVYIIYV
jgi:hypothetical protein